jgi:hypothetical protein
MISVTINGEGKNVCIEGDRIEIVDFLESNESLLSRSDVLIILFLSYCFDKKLIQAHITLKKLFQKDISEVCRAYSDLALENAIPVINVHLPSALTEVGKAIWSLIDSFFSVFDEKYSDSLHHYLKPESENKLVEYVYSPNPRESVLVDCYMRRYWWDDVPTTREHDVGPRLTTAFRNGGWDSRLQFLEKGAHPNLSGTSGARIAVVDLQSNFFSKPSEKAYAYLEILRKSYDITVGIFFDSWMGSATSVKNYADVYFDWFWCPNAPASPIGKEALDFPMPLGVAMKSLKELRQSVAVDNRVRFKGSIEHVNLARFYWKSTLSKTGICDFNDHPHKNDGLSVSDSYVEYLKEIANSAACLNFSMRGDGQRVITGRAFESIAIGQPLLQEFANGLSNYFSSDEHYFEFKNVEDLLGFFDRMDKDPSDFVYRAENGYLFWDARYADDMLVRHFNKKFFG